MLFRSVKVVKNNHDRSVTGLRFFEIEKVYLQPADAKAHPNELEVLGLITDEGYAVAKGAVENALSAFLAVGSLSFEPADAAHMVPGRAVVVLVDGSRVGWCGEVSPRLLDALDLKSPVWAAELDFEALGGYSDKPLRSFDNSRIPRYPSVERDFAFVLPEEVRWADIEKTVFAACSDAPVEGVKFFDIYRGKQIAEGMKSVALRVVFRSPSGTLTDEQLTAPVSRIVEEMGSKFGATLRSR